MSCAVKFQALPTGVLEEIFSPENVRGRNSLSPLSFPKSRSALWDSSPVGEKLRLQLCSHRKPRLLLLEKTLRLAQRHARHSNKPRLHGFFLGSVSVDADEEGVTVTLDRFDPGREQPGAAGRVPSALLPRDVLVPCWFSTQTEMTADVVVQSEAELHHCFKVLQQYVSSKQALDLSQLLKVRSYVHCQQQSDAAAFTLRWSAVCPAVSVDIQPVRAVPIIPTALARSLTSVSQPHATTCQRGFLTMDQTRKLLLLLESDPKASNLPLVGLWLSGVTHASNPQVWSWCLRFLFSSTIQDRVLSESSCFLLVVFAATHKAPQFFQCRGPGPGQQLDCQLLSASQSLTLYQVAPVDGQTLQCELSSEDPGRQMQVFREAQNSFNGTPPLPAGLSVSDQDSGVEDLSPRPSPSPHVPSQQTRRVQPSVPELSLLIDSSFTSSNQTAWQDPGSTHRPSPDRNSVPPPGNASSSSSSSALRPAPPPHLHSTPNSNLQQPCACCPAHTYNCTSIFPSPGLHPAAAPLHHVTPSHHMTPPPKTTSHHMTPSPASSHQMTPSPAPSHQMTPPPAPSHHMTPPTLALSHHMTPPPAPLHHLTPPPPGPSHHMTPPPAPSHHMTPPPAPSHKPIPPSPAPSHHLTPLPSASSHQYNTPVGPSSLHPATTLPINNPAPPSSHHSLLASAAGPFHHHLPTNSSSPTSNYHQHNTPPPAHPSGLLPTAPVPWCGDSPSSHPPPLPRPSCVNPCCEQQQQVGVIPSDTYQLLLHQDRQLRLLQAQVQMLLEAQGKLQSCSQEVETQTPRNTTSIAVGTGASLFWGTPVQLVPHQEVQAPPTSLPSTPSSPRPHPSSQDLSAIRPEDNEITGQEAPCSPSSQHSFGGPQSPVLGESVSMYKPAEEQQSFYHNLMTQLTSRLQESDGRQEGEEVESRRSSLSVVSNRFQPSSASSSSSSPRRKQPGCGGDPVVSATLRRLQQLGVHVEGGDLTESDRKIHETVESSSTLACINPTAVLSRLSVSEPAASALFPGGSVDLSLEANAIALRYLSDSQLSRLSLGGHAPRPGPTSSTESMLSPSNMSLATKKYMRRYGLIEEENCDEEGEEEEEVQEASARQPLTASMNLKLLPQSQLIRDLRPKMQQLAAAGNLDKENYSSRQPSLVRASSRQTDGSVGNILDLSRLRQLPKLF